MNDSDLVISVTKFVPANSAEIFELLADPRRHHEIDGSDSVLAARVKAPKRLELGSKFGMRMRIKVPYLITNKVVEFEDGKQIGWRHIGQHIWRYQLEPVEGGTKVTETFDWRPSPVPWLLHRQNIPKKNLASMEQTLARLDSYVTTGNVPEP